MATQLGVINDALGMLGEEGLALSELSGLTREPARVMAPAWLDAADFCLSAAPWQFASRLVELVPYGATLAEQQQFAAPGYSRAWMIPDDHLRTNWLRDTPFPDSLPIQMVAQDGYWHTNTGSLFLNYVSHEYRAPESWTPMFAKAVAGYLAWTKGPRIRPASDANELRLKYEALMMAAKTQDASEMPFAWQRSGRLVRSRGGYRDNFSGGGF